MSETVSPAPSGGVKLDIRHFVEFAADLGKTIGYQEAQLHYARAEVDELRTKLVSTTVDADFHRGLSQIHAQEASRLRKKYEGGEKAKGKPVRKK